MLAAAIVATRGINVTENGLRKIQCRDLKKVIRSLNGDRASLH